MKTTTSTITSPFILAEDGTVLPTVENFYKYCVQRKLMGTECVKCGHLTCPPRGICPQCSGTKIKWIQLTGHGTLLTYTVIHFPPTQFQALAPYAVGIVEMKEGPRLPGMIRNIKPDELKIGAALRIEFDTATPEEWPRWPRYYFLPAQAI